MTAIETRLGITVAVNKEEKEEEDFDLFGDDVRTDILTHYILY